MMAISHTALCAVLDKRSFSVETPAAAGLNLNLSKFKPKYHGNHQNRLFYHLSLFFTLFRCFCKDCLNVLVGAGTFDKLKEVDPWSCYICLPSKCYGVLKLRPDWSVRVQEYFANNSAFEFVSVHLILLMLDIQYMLPFLMYHSKVGSFLFCFVFFLKP